MQIEKIQQLQLKKRGHFEDIFSYGQSQSSEAIGFFIIKNPSRNQLDRILFSKRKVFRNWQVVKDTFKLVIFWREITHNVVREGFKVREKLEELVT